MSYGRVTKIVLEHSIERIRKKGKPKQRWKDGRFDQKQEGKQNRKESK